MCSSIWIGTLSLSCPNSRSWFFPNSVPCPTSSDPLPFLFPPFNPSSPLNYKLLPFSPSSFHFQYYHPYLNCILACFRNLPSLPEIPELSGQTASSQCPTSRWGALTPTCSERQTVEASLVYGGRQEVPTFPLTLILDISDPSCHPIQHLSLTTIITSDDWNETLKFRQVPLGEMTPTMRTILARAADATAAVPLPLEMVLVHDRCWLLCCDIITCPWRKVLWFIFLRTLISCVLFDIDNLVSYRFMSWIIVFRLVNQSNAGGMSCLVYK